MLGYTERDMFVRQIYDEGLAQYAYLIGCQQTGEALLIDPERDVDRYLAIAEAQGLRISAVAETHIHADFLSGARELADRGAVAYLSGEGDAETGYAWPFSARHTVRLVRDGDAMGIGKIEIRVVHTPGHTPEHLGFFVTDRGGGADAPMAFASGDFLFVGDVGRPDLLETAVGISGTMRPAAHRLGESLRSFASQPDGVQIWPGHGAGSACGKSLGAVPVSTVGYERRFNQAFSLAIASPEAFVDAILDDQPEPPPYFASMKRLNRTGPPILGPLPQPPVLSEDGLTAMARRDDVVLIDTRRDRGAFMASHIAGSLFAPLDRTFATVIGSFVETGVTVVLLADESDAEDAVRQLVRIGVDRIAGRAPAALAASLGRASIPRMSFADLREYATGDSGTVLDVRRASEHRAAHVRGALNVPHTRLMTRLGEIPRGRPVAVHCASGARAAVASAALARAGYDVRLVDDKFTNWRG